MKWFVAVLLGALLWTRSDFSLASDAVQVFASELLAFESKQVLRPDRPVQYVDADGGEVLRALLAPERATRVLDQYFEELVKGSSPVDVNKLLGPLVKRYEQAFVSNPEAYEKEYLDALNWVVSSMERSTKRTSTLMEKQAEMTDAESSILQSLQSFGNSMLKLVSQSMLDKVNRGMHSSAGSQRALDMVGRINTLVSGTTVSTPQQVTRVRAIASGKQVFESQCAACHLTGTAGAPRLGDLKSWQPRIASGFNALVKATLKGKGAMGTQGGGAFQDFEIARAVAYLANLSGASFKEPDPPAGHPGTVTMPPLQSPRPSPPEIPYARMSAEQRLKFGEQVYSKHCLACHQTNGHAVGPIKSMINAPAFRRNDTAIDLVLNGSNGSVIAMPSFSILKDEEIAEVINFSRFKYSRAPALRGVKPSEVAERRK